MPVILFFSSDELFSADLLDQLKHHAPEFSVVDSATSVVPDIIVVDEDLNKLDEFHRQYSQAPIFLFSSQSDTVKNYQNLQHLIVKPFSLDSFLNELRSSLNIFENSTNGYLEFNQYLVRPIKKEILNQRNNEITKLTEKEVAIIKYLYKVGERIVSKTELLQEVWGYAPDVTTHTIETHVYRLRQKVEHDNPDAQLIVTLEGGYQLKM